MEFRLWFVELSSSLGATRNAKILSRG